MDLTLEEIDRLLLDDCELPSYGSESECDGDSEADDENCTAGNTSFSSVASQQNDIVNNQPNWSSMNVILPEEDTDETIERQSEMPSDSSDSEDETGDWHKNKKWFTESIAPVPPFTEKASPIHLFSGIDSPLIFFERFFNDIEILLVQETNMYASQKNIPDWKDVTIEELRAFIGVLILMGIHNMPTINSYWSSNPLLGVPAVSNVMTNKRFHKILSALHCNDNDKQPNRNDATYDKLYKVRPLLNKINKHCLAECKASSHHSIDESMIAFKGRSTMKQYLPLKPIKRGYKAWSRADSESGYLYEFEIYTGKTGNTVEQNLGHKVVVSLTKNIEHSLSMATFDNFFTSTALLEELVMVGIWSCGTVRANRKNLPVAMSVNNRMDRGEYKWRTNGNVSAVQWKDNKHVNLLSTAHDPLEVVQISRKKKDGTKEILSCPKAIQGYNNYMGGVDKFDQMRQYYMVGRRSKKWWHRIFYFILDVAIVNSFVLFNFVRLENDKPEYTQLEYRLRLIAGLIGGFSSKKAKGPKPTYLSKKKGVSCVPIEVRCQSLGVHLPGQLETYRRCRYCSTVAKEKRTKVRCTKCDVPLCAVPCFQKFHV